MIKAIFIDADNTLLDFDKCSLLAMKEAYKSINVPFFDEYYGIFHAENDRLWASHERGEIGKDGIFGVRWKNIFAKEGINADPYAFETVFKGNIDRFAEKVDGAEEIMRYLSGKYDVYIISNAAERQQVARIKMAGLDGFVKKIFTSEALGCSKPDAAYFEKCFALSGYGADEICVIGDSPTADIKGGKITGCKTVWFDFHKTGNDKGIKADNTVKKLSEIKNIL